MKWGLSDQQIDEIIGVLASYDQVDEAILFGSRAMDTYKEASDIDIALKGQGVDERLASKVKFSLEEDTRLPFFFDVVAYSAVTSKHLGEQIKRFGKVLYRKGWRWVRLGDVIKSNQQSIDKSYKYTLIEYLDTGSITEGKIESFQTYKLSDAPSRAKRLVKNNSIIYSTVRPIQRHYGFIKNPLENLVVSTGFSVIEAIKKISEPLFIYYFLTSNDIVEKLDIIAEGGVSVYPSLKPSDIENLNIHLPSIEEQRGIAEVLSSLDDKIELLRCQNRTLEDMAQCLFRKRFIEDADPTWPIGKLTSEFEFTMGTSPPGHSYNEKREGTPMFQGNADFGFRFPMNRIHTRMPKRFAKKFDTLISVRAPVGEQNMAKEKCCIGRGLAAFRYKHNNAYYTYTYFKIKSIIDKIKAFQNTGTVFGAINKKDFEDMDISIPSKKFILDFQNKVKHIDDKIILNEFSIFNLENLRNMLLPKVINGQVRII